MQISRQAHNYSYVHVISNFVLLTFFKPLDPTVKRQIYSYIETISNYGHIISNSVGITRYRPSLLQRKPEVLTSLHMRTYAVSTQLVII